MSTEKAFRMMLREVSPERAGRVGYLRKLNAEKAKKSAEFWNNDDAWGAAKKAQQKYDSHTATVDRHMKKFSRDRDSDWAKKLAAGYKGEETDVKNMRRNIKIGAGVGLGLAGAYGAYRLLRGKKKPIEKEKAVAPTKTAAPKKHVIDTRQDPTEPASYPFKDSASTDAVWANLMEGAIANYLKHAREFSKQHKKPFKVTRMRGPKGERIVNVQGISPSGSMFHPTSPKAVLHASHEAGLSKLSPSARQSIHSPEEFLAAAKKLPVKKANPKTLQHELVHYNDNTHVPRSERIAGIMNKHLQATKGKPDEAFMRRGERLMIRTHLRGEAKAFTGLVKQRKGKKPTKLTANDRDMRSGMASYLRMGRAYKLPDLNKRYKNFKAAGGYDSPTAHLKLSTDATWANLMEVSRGLLHRARIAAGAKMERIKIAQNRLRSAPNFLGDRELGGNPIYNARNAWRDDIVKSIKDGEKKIIGATKVAPGTYHKLGPQMGAKYDVTNRSSASRYRFDIHSRKARGVDGIANQIYDSGYGKAEKQFWRFDDAIKRPKNHSSTKTTSPDNSPKWGKRAAVGLGIAAAGYGAYRLNKWRKGRKKEVKESEYLPGGRAEGKSSRIFPKGQLRMGRRVEMEHTRNPRVAEEIAKDHLTEFKDYYTRLAQMEREAKRSRR